jgi:hypothetical protein
MDYIQLLMQIHQVQLVWLLYHQDSKRIFFLNKILFFIYIIYLQALLELHLEYHESQVPKNKFKIKEIK